MLGAINRAIAPRWVLANTSGGGPDADHVVQQVPGTIEEFARRPLGHTWVQFRDMADTVARRLALSDPSGYLILDTLSTGGSPTDDRTRMAAAVRRRKAAGVRPLSVVARLVERGRARQARLLRPPWLANAGAAGVVRPAAEQGEQSAATAAIPPGTQARDQATSRTLAASARARSFFRLWCSIWRIRTRVTLNARPTSSSDRGWRPSSP
jgi:hypothetical protein